MTPVDDDRGVAGHLLRVAAAVLGDDRAVELQGALLERAEQYERVRHAVGGSVRPVTSAVAHGRPTPASLAAWAACRRQIETLDERLRAWAWTAPVEPAGDEPSGEHSMPALDGYAIGVKDVIDVAGMPTRSGSPLTSPEPAPADAPLVARLRAAGAAIVGKTHCTEWALNDPAPTRNPWNPSRTPGGSSAGSAVVVSARMCRATIDTQTAGDVLRPAAYNGVVGFKPTIGWTPIEGTEPVAPTIDTIGVTASRVDDVAAVAAAIADEPGRFTGDTGPAPPRLGVLHDAFYEDIGPAVRTNFGEVLRRFVHAGAELTDLPCPVDLSLVHAAHRIITFAECAAHHLSRYRTDGERFGRRARELIDLGLFTPAHAYIHAQDVRREATAQLAGMLGNVDVLMLPVTPEPAPSPDTTGDSRFQIPWTLCGFPALALPSGRSAELPLAVQVVASAQNEAGLLSAARWCEQVLDLHLTLPAT